MATSWEKVRLGDLVHVKHGFAFQGRYFRSTPPGDILLTPGNFAIGGGFRAGKPKFYDGPVTPEYVLARGDLVVTMTDLSKGSDTLGYPAFVSDPPDQSRYLHNQRIGKMVLRTPERLDTTFLHYRLCAPDYRAEVLASATGTTVRHTSPSRIEAFEFGLPPLETQRSIGRVLAALDARATVERQIIASLELTLERLYGSWFVDFEPVKARVAGRPTRLNPKLADLFPRAFDQGLPRGWRKVRLGEILSFAKGRKPKLESASPVGEAESPVILIDTLDGQVPQYAPSTGMVEAKLDDILMVMDGASSGRVETGFEGLVGSTLARVDIADRRIGKRFAYQALKQLQSEIRLNLTGTSIPHADKRWILQQGVTLPDSAEIMDRFKAAADLAGARIVLARARIQTVRSMREVLLSPLVTGRVRAPTLGAAAVT